MEMGVDFFLREDHVFVETLDDAGGGVSEQQGLDIVPLPGNGVQTVVAPACGQDIVLALDQAAVVHHDGDGLAGQVPASDTEEYPFAFGVFTPFGI